VSYAWFDKDGQPGFVYRYFDASGRLLYVGCTTNMARRAVKHRYERWFKFHTSVTVERYETLRQAIAAETLAIKTENAVYNKKPVFDLYVWWDGVKAYEQAAA
jgi:predicted GIY-YIG superfamily endonuclease